MAEKIDRLISALTRMGTVTTFSKHELRFFALEARDLAEQIKYEEGLGANRPRPSAKKVFYSTADLKQTFTYAWKLGFYTGYIGDDDIASDRKEKFRSWRDEDWEDYKRGLEVKD